MIDHRRLDCGAKDCPVHLPRQRWGVIGAGCFTGCGYCDVCGFMGAANDATWLARHLASEGHKELVGRT